MDMMRLREALEASWQPDTAYLQASKEGNPALGQCYPTSRVVQHFFPSTEIVEGDVQVGLRTEKHFWNILEVNGSIYHIDLSWQQFPHGSIVKSFRVRDRNKFSDGPETVLRVELLLQRVHDYLNIANK